MLITIKQRGMEITPAIRQYVEEKMQSLDKYFDAWQIDVEIGYANKHQQKGDVYECKAVVQYAGEVFSIEKDAEDLYKAIDKVKDHLRVELTQRKEKLQERSQGKG
jgi:putative sigma-54 modulation protein